MTDDAKKQNRTQLSGLQHWALAVTLFLNVISAVAAGFFYYKYTIADHGLKKGFYAFCVERSKEWNNDKRAREICEEIFKKSIDASADSGVFVNPYLFARVVGYESLFCSEWIGSSGDYGCSQININAHGRYPYGCDILDRGCNLYSGAMILAESLKAFNGNERLALYGYNRGKVAVQRALMRGENPSNGYAAKVMA